MKTFEKLQLIKEMTTQLDYSLLDYSYFKKHYKMLAIGLSKQQALDADPKAIQQINFTGNISGNNNIFIFFIIEEGKETILDFSQGTMKVL